MKVDLKTAFSILDGRLSTDIGEVYKMLNYIFDMDIMTHQIPTALRKLEEINPKWYSEGKNFLLEIKVTNKTDNFEELMKIIDENYSDIEIELEEIDFDIDFFAGLENFVEKE